MNARKTTDLFTLIHVSIIQTQNIKLKTLGEKMKYKHLDLIIGGILVTISFTIMSTLLWTPIYLFGFFLMIGTIRSIYNKKFGKWSYWRKQRNLWKSSTKKTGDINNV